MIYDQPRMTDPLLEAQRTLLQSRTPVRYQPLLTPDNYLNFYGTPQGVAPSAQDLLYPRIQRGAVAAPAATGGSYMPMSMGGDSGSSSQSEPSAWDKMTEYEKAQWVQANPGTYIAGKTLASAVLPGGMLLAGMQDPYMNMSLAEYYAGKASQAAMGGMRPEGYKGEVEVAQPVFDPNIYGYDYTSAPSLLETVAPAVPGGTRSISGDAPQVRDYVAEAAAVRAEAQRAADEAAAAQAAAAQSSPTYYSQPYYQTQDTSSYSDYAGAGQTQMDRSLQSQSDYYG